MGETIKPWIHGQTLWTGEQLIHIDVEPMEIEVDLTCPECGTESCDCWVWEYSDGFDE